MGAIVLLGVRDTPEFRRFDYFFDLHMSRTGLTSERKGPLLYSNPIICFF